VQVVLLFPGLEVVGLDADHDVLHGGDPPSGRVCGQPQPNTIM
jgi:hypothetical protein